MEKERIKSYVASIINSGHEFGIKVYTIINSLNNAEIKEMLIEDKLKNHLSDMIENELNRKLLCEDILIEDSKNISEQRVNCLYDIRTSESYNPFSFLDNIDNNIDQYDVNEGKNITGFLFKINLNENCFWAFQQIYPVNKISKKKSIPIISKDTVFELIDKDIILLSSRIDLLVIKNHIVTDNIKLLQDKCGFDQFIRMEANLTLEKIITKGLLSNPEMLANAIGQDKTTVAKKIMKAKNSPVFSIDNEELFRSIKKHNRYKNLISFDNDKIIINTKNDVENFIKMLNDDFLKSELTQIEYDSETKTII